MRDILSVRKVSFTSFIDGLECTFEHSGILRVISKWKVDPVIPFLPSYFLGVSSYIRPIKQLLHSSWYDNFFKEKPSCSAGQTRGKLLLAKTPTKTSINEGNLTLCCLWYCNYAEMIFIPFQTLWTTTTGPRTRPAFASHLPSASAWWTPAPWRPRPKAGQQSRRFRPVPSIPGNWAGRSGSGPRRPSALMSLSASEKPTFSNTFNWRFV